MTIATKQRTHTVCKGICINDFFREATVIHFFCKNTNFLKLLFKKFYDYAATMLCALFIMAYTIKVDLDYVVTVDEFLKNLLRYFKDVLIYMRIRNANANLKNNINYSSNTFQI